MLWQTDTTQLDLARRHVEAFVTWLEDFRKLEYPSAHTAANSLSEELEISIELKDFRQRQKHRVLGQKCRADPMKSFGVALFPCDC